MEISHFLMLQAAARITARTVPGHRVLNFMKRSEAMAAVRGFRRSREILPIQLTSTRISNNRSIVEKHGGRILFPVKIIKLSIMFLTEVVAVKDRHFILFMIAIA